jgi:hypothetical protein
MVGWDGLLLLLDWREDWFLLPFWWDEWDSWVFPVDWWDSGLLLLE